MTLTFCHAEERSPSHHKVDGSKEDPKISQGFVHLYLILCSSQMILLSYDLACGTTTTRYPAEVSLSVVSCNCPTGQVIAKKYHLAAAENQV